MKSKEISNEEERCSCINKESNWSQNVEKQEEIEDNTEVDYNKLIEDQLNIEIDQLSTPFWVSKLIVNFPIIIIWTVFSIMIAITVIVIATGAATPKETYYRDPLVLGSKLVNDYDIIYLTQKTIEESFSGGLQPLRTMKQGDFQTFILFECTSWDTILTVDFLKKMFEIEQKIYQQNNFKNFWLAKSTSDSSWSSYSYLSFTRNFPNMDTLTHSQIDSVLAYMITNETFYHNNYFYFENSFDKTNLKSKKARAIFTFATPIEIDGVRYSTSSDRFFDQAAKFVEFSYSMESDVYSVQTSLNVRFYNGYWAQDLIKKWIIEDFKLIIFSFIIVFVYVSFQTQSMFLTSIKLWGVALAYPFSIFIGRYIFSNNLLRILEPCLYLHCVWRCNW